MPLLARFPIPLSIRACGFPAHGLPTVVLAWLRCLRITDSTHELMQALVVEPGFRPPRDLSRMEVASAFLDHREKAEGVAGAWLIVGKVCAGTPTRPRTSHSVHGWSPTVLSASEQSPLHLAGSRACCRR